MIQSREHIRRTLLGDGRLGSWPLGDLLPRLEEVLARNEADLRRLGAANRVCPPGSRQMRVLGEQVTYWKGREGPAAREVNTVSMQLADIRNSQLHGDHEIDLLRTEMLALQNNARTLARDKDSADRRLSIKENELSLVRQRYRQFRASAYDNLERAEVAEKKVADLKTEMTAAENASEAKTKEINDLKGKIAAVEEKMANLRSERNLWRDTMMARYSGQWPIRPVTVLPPHERRTSDSSVTS